MKKPLLLAVAVFFFAQCNRSTEQKPDAPHAGKNTLTEMFMQSFNAKPAAKSLYVKFEPSDKDIPRAQDAAILHLLADLKTQPQRFVIDATEKTNCRANTEPRFLSSQTVLSHLAEMKFLLPCRLN